jgi:hypothetical protein
MIEAQQPQGEQSSQYLPAGPPDPLIFEAFEGMNTATLRPGVDDKQAYWLDSFMPLGPRRNLRTMYGKGPTIAVAPESSYVCFDIANIRSTPISIMTLADGSLYQVNLNTGAQTLMAPAGTMLNPTREGVGVTQWGSQYVLIVGAQTNGYFIWDGANFYSPGQTAPGGIGTMPLGIGGSCIETYAGRVWIGNGPIIFFSAPGSFIDFSSANGGGNFTSVDSFLKQRFVALKQNNGFLYLVADSSINYISGVQTSGSPPVTTFTNQNADPEVGSPYQGSIMVFNRNILLANAFGAHVAYGGAVTKISEALDGVFNTITDFGGVPLSAAKAILFGKKCWVLLVRIIDPILNVPVNKLFLWNGKFWWAATQEANLIYIGYQELNSVLTAWATDGQSFFALFQQPSTGLNKVAQTRLWDNPGGYQENKTATRIWAVVKYYLAQSPNVSLSIDNENANSLSQAVVAPGVSQWVTAGGQVSVWTNRFNVVAAWLGTGTFALASPTAVGLTGAFLGMTIQTQCADMAVVSAMMDAKIAGYRG